MNDVTDANNDDDTQNNNTANNITEVHVENQESLNTTGVRQNDVNEDIGAIQNYEQTEYEDDQDDDLLIENESHDDAYISMIKGMRHY